MVTKQAEMFSFVDKSREAVFSYDVSGLSENVDTAELIGTIIGENADDVTCMKLKSIGLRNLMEYSINELMDLALGKNEAIQLHASFLLTKRLFQEKKGKSCIIRSPKDAADCLYDLKYEKQEHFVALFLNTKNEVVKRKTISIGSLNATIVHPREIFREAVKISAASVIVGHNHPSSDPSPSQEDIQVTKRLTESGKMLGIEVLDHIIIGQGFKSLKEQGYM
ncbi:DNA repair protein RadC [Lentibacillus sp. N15]|uniref:RadC family protein n=1 Tax=Lentibacillus songyuanensis TaxID=3136161 RepID=UPI0031BA2F8C